MKNNHRISAFSLIEISIVILIIGILIAGVTQASRLVTHSKMSSARTMTQSSPVASIKNLSLWIESTSEGSFQSSDLDDATSIDTWNDINPQVVTKANLTGTTTTRPVYKVNIINGLPAVLFDGAGDFVTTSNFSNITTASTVFVVAKLPSSISTAQTIFSKRPTTGTGMNIQFGFTAATGWNYSDGTTTYTPTAASAPTAASGSYVVSVVYTSNSATGGGTSTSQGYNFFQNGGSTGYTATYGATTGGSPSSIADNFLVGKSGLTATPASFGGYIGEIIIFDRALKKEERQSIEAYLGKKWGITMTVASY